MFLQKPMLKQNSRKFKKPMKFCPIRRREVNTTNSVIKQQMPVLGKVVLVVLVLKVLTLAISFQPSLVAVKEPHEQPIVLVKARIFKNA
jgi:hypothetical protein